MAVARLQLQILRNDPWFLIIMFAMPLGVMPFFKKIMGLSLLDSGYPSANGAEQVVPGQVVLFGFFVAGSVGYCVFREHGWRTWDRLRSSALSPRSLLLGIAIPWVAIHIVYQSGLFLVGGLMLGLRFNGGSPFATLLLVISYATCVISLILLMAATFRTINQVSAFQNLGAMLFAGLGGALVPIEQLPGLARVAAPLTPAFWAMRGHRTVFLDSGGVADVLLPITVLFGSATLIGIAAIWRFRVDETKEFFA